MPALHLQPCLACNAKQVDLSAEQWPELLAQLDGWSIEHTGTHLQLSKDYAFANFEKAMDFANHVAQLAETEQHHPKMLIEWGRVRLSWWTHRTQGLHLNDFILAARCDQL